MEYWTDWLVDNPRDHAWCPGLTEAEAASAQECSIEDAFFFPLRLKYDSIATLPCLSG